VTEDGTVAVESAKDVGGASKPAPVRNGLTSIIVKLGIDAVADYRGGVPGFAPTAPTGGSELNLSSPAAKSYLAYVDGVEQSIAGQIKADYPQTRVTANYDVVYGGMAMLVPPDSIEQIEALKNVERVQPDTLLHVDTDHSPAFLGAPTVWAGLGLPWVKGANEIVAVLDTGIWPEHPSFSPTPSDGTGTPIPAPPPPLSGTRACQFSGGANPGPAFTCNNKLIGAQRFMATYDALVGVTPAEYTSARDDDGHGTHTSSTAAGDRGVQASIFGVNRGPISGIDPRAHVMMYKVCGIGGCFSSDSMAAVQRAVTDGANVINFSISGGANPYADPVELAFLSAYSSGVFVAASAGNSGPTPDTTDHRGPWTTTAAASTEDRSFNSTVFLRGSDGAVIQLPGVSVSANAPIAPVVNAADAPTNDAFCANGPSDNAFAGKIVICERGAGIGRAEKGLNVKNRGAVGMILYNPTPQDVETDNHWLPGVHLDADAGNRLLQFMATHTGVMSTWASGQPSPAKGDVMAAFSSRGGPGQSIGISKPDVTAPGVQILAGNTPTPDDPAAGPPGQLFQAIAGTSMSSPHVAGAAALIRALHPSWTPGQIKSALMTTATQNVLKEDNTSTATPFDDGSGRIDLRAAANPGITFDETGASYGSFAGNPQNLFQANYPSVFIPNMPGVVTVQRTAHSVLGAPSLWSISAFSQSGLVITPTPQITVPAGGNTAFSIKVDASALPIGAVRYGYVRLTDNAGHNAVLPVTVVRGQAPVTLDKVCTPPSVKIGTGTGCTITATNTTFTPANVTIGDQLPSNLQIGPGSISGASQAGNGVAFSGTIAAAQPPGISVAPGLSPAGGYLPLSLFGIAPIANPGDDAIINFNTPPYLYGGEVYTSVGFSTNGYVVIGGGSGSDNSISNQQFPNANRPNNVIAPFWTDLWPSAGGSMRIGVLTDGSNDWIVLDWNAVREFSTPGNTHSMEIWLGVRDDASPVEDNTYTYGPTTGGGDGGFVTEGAENKFGNSGTTVFFNGTGTAPANGQQYAITASAPAVTTKTITLNALGQLLGTWRNCATMTADIFVGTSVACINGDVHP